MNENGQILLFDVIMALIILFIVLAAIVYVTSQEDDYVSDYDSAQEALDLLVSTKIGNESLLSALSDGDATAKNVTRTVLSDYKYYLKDNTIGETLVNETAGSYHRVISSVRVVDNHEYQLYLYF